MWALDNVTPYAADRSWVRDRDGGEVWLVAVKGTFDIHPDGSTGIAGKQVEIKHTAEYSGAPGKSSLLYESDLPRTKVATDVIVNGSAHAPRGEPTKAVTVGFRVGKLAKSLEVTGDLFWEGVEFLTWQSGCKPFVKMPITYERAYGGRDRKQDMWETRNPVGTGFASQRGHLVGMQAPNLHASGSSSWFQDPCPVGFGAIAGHWSPRVQFAGTYDEKWEAGPAPLLPHDFDDRYYQCAPADQQAAGFLIGGEEVHLKNLTPGGYLAFKLPRVVLGFETDFGDEVVRHRANLHTVILEPDIPRVIMVWHTALPCHSKVTKLIGTRIFEKSVLSQSADVSGSDWTGGEDFEHGPE